MMRDETSLEALLDALTEAALADQALEPVLTRYPAIPRAEAHDSAVFIRRLRRSLVQVQPAPRFVTKLKVELMGAPQPSVLSPLRGLPTRVRLATGLVAVAGFVLLLRSRVRQWVPVAAGNLADEDEVKAVR
ncbi:MAG: hypothetical protein H7Y11_13050 [Armatimonadetes bacterium]|nr:hypothetical protein [Anaerolineae bacterium]